jgi:hypothetical protein
MFFKEVVKINYRITNKIAFNLRAKKFYLAKKEDFPGYYSEAIGINKR